MVLNENQVLLKHSQSVANATIIYGSNKTTSQKASLVMALFDLDVLIENA
jgi:hypothetical protein